MRWYCALRAATDRPFRFFTGRAGGGATAAAVFFGGRPRLLMGPWRASIARLSSSRPAVSRAMIYHRSDAGPYNAWSEHASVEPSESSSASVSWTSTIPPMDSGPSSRLLLPMRSEDHAHGSADAPYTLVEYGDYECPDCGRLYVVLRDLQKDIASRLRVVFRHYPLSGVHHHAQQAAEAAGAQGKFWEMHALLFERQEALHTKHLIRYAEELTLDVERFRDELKNQTYSDNVRADFIAGVQNGVYRTPGLFLNEVRYDDPWDGEALQSALHI